MQQASARPPVARPTRCRSSRRPARSQGHLDRTCRRTDGWRDAPTHTRKTPSQRLPRASGSMPIQGASHTRTTRHIRGLGSPPSNKATQRSRTNRRQGAQRPPRLALRRLLRQRVEDRSCVQTWATNTYSFDGMSEREPRRSSLRRANGPLRRPRNSVSHRPAHQSPTQQHERPVVRMRGGSGRDRAQGRDYT